MIPLRLSTCLLIGGALALVAVAGHAGDPQGRPDQTEPPKGAEPPKKPVNEIVQEFPTNGEMETAWKIRWATTTGYGLYIQDAWFKRSPTDRWVQILGDARVSEI